MILLTSTTDKLQIISASAVTVDVHVSWADSLSGAITPGRTNTAITLAATTDVVAAPAASTQRNVQTINIRNKHATSSNLITVQHTDGTTVAQLVAYTLLAGEELTFLDSVGWRVMDAAGGVKEGAATGRLLRSTVLTAGTSFTTGPDTRQISVRLQAGGGAGGGCTSVASAAGAAGGGSAGGYAEKLFTVTPNTAYTYAIGAGGAGASGAIGGVGGNTTLTVGAVTVTAFGGNGAAVATASTALTAYQGGASPAVSTNGDVNGTGVPGLPGITLIVATPVVCSGGGGSSLFGAGALGRTASADGIAASIGYGGGGGGAATGASLARAGGNGTAGCITVDEYS